MWSTHVKNHSTLGRPLASLIFSDQTVLIIQLVPRWIQDNSSLTEKAYVNSTKDMPFVLNPTWNFFKFRSGLYLAQSNDKKTKMIKFSLKMIMAQKSCWNRIEKRLIGPQFDWRLKNILRTFASSSTVPWKTLLDEKMEFFEIVWNNLFHNWNFRNRLWSYQLGARPSLHGPSNGNPLDKLSSEIEPSWNIWCHF